MTSASSAHGLPAWVKKRDGRVVPFEADCITAALFAATEALGQPDAFLARELTDGVLHFLAAESAGSVPTTEEIAELVIKVVRELRHPQLAHAFARRQQAPQRHEIVLPLTPGVMPTEFAAQSLRAYSLQTVFSRDLAAAVQSGLLVPGGLEKPLQLEAATLGQSRGSLLEAFIDAREHVAGWLTIDGPEHDTGAGDASAFLGQARLACHATGLAARLQLNVAAPPTWAQEGAAGPLFADTSGASAVDQARTVALAEAWLELNCPALALDWHMDQREDRSSALLLRLARAALEGRPVTFVFDRPRRPVWLGPGLDRKHTALLMSVGLDLPRLLEHTGIQDNVELFLLKLASLARWAVSAAVQKRQFVRRGHADSAAVSRGFLLDRARVLVRPLGLEAAVRRLTGVALAPSKEALETGRRIVQQLHEVLAAEGKRRLVDGVVDLEEEKPGRVGGPLPAITSAASGLALLPDQPVANAEELVRVLRYLWQRTDAFYLRLATRVPKEYQPTLATNFIPLQ